MLVEESGCFVGEPVKNGLKVKEAEPASLGADLLSMAAAGYERGKSSGLDVSVIVAAYNVAPFVSEAVHSALCQKGISLEVIVVDDHSDDETADIVAEIAAGDPRVRLIRQRQRSGPSAARNAAFEQARGEWLAILDADDFFAPHRLRMLVDLATTTSADLVADNYERVDSSGLSLGSTMIPEGLRPYSFKVDPASFIDANVVLTKTHFTLGAIKPRLRRDFLSSHDISYRTDLECGEDYDILVACLARGATFVVTSEVAYSYRMRQGSQSWRINSDHVSRLLHAHRATRFEEAFVGQPPVLAAARRFERALERTQAFLSVVSAVKGGNLGTALLESFSTPRIWPLLLRYGAEGTGRRMGLVR